MPVGFLFGRHYWSSSKVLRADDQRYYLGREPLNSTYFNGRTESSEVGWLKVTAYIYPSSQQMWTEVAPAIMQKAGPRNHTLLSFPTSTPRKRKRRILQAQVRRMVVSSSGLDELVKSFQRIGKALFQTLATSSIFTQQNFFNPQNMKSCQIGTQFLEIGGKKMLTCQVAPKAKMFNNV